MTIRSRILFSAWTFCFLLNPFVLADDLQDPTSDGQAKAETEAKPEVFSLSGVFEAIKSEELLIDNEHFTSLEIKKIVPHGSLVKKGQNIVWFETDDINKQLREAEIDLRLAKLKLSDDEFAYQQYLKKQKLDREKALRARDQAQQSFDNFTEIDRDRHVLSAEFSLKSSRANLENVQEELEQLTQMYEEDDLTEESEEIVLKRAKQAVESAEFRLAGTEIASDRTVSQSIPRSEAEQDASLARAFLNFQKSIRDMESEHTRQTIDIDRERSKFKEQEKKVEEQRAERKRVVLKSPIDGIVVHGKLNRGKIAEKASTLKKGSKVKDDQVLATVVNPNQLRIRVSIDEKDLGKVAVGDQCKVVPKAMPDLESSGVILSISSVAYAGTKYDGLVKLQKNRDLRGMILPTMTCELKFPKKKQDNESDDSAKATGSDGDDA